MIPEKSVGLIDLDALRRYAANHDALFETLIELFFEQAPLWIGEIDRAFATQNPSLVRQVCHKIKGSAATLHASLIVAEADKLHSCAVSGDLSDAEPLRARLVAAISDTVVLLRQSSAT
ncbi:MAG: Hpt domain-containing protein [Desulfobulbaceae bacterium]|nr:Hpt domain-containing protein [Desulfobulbaceae bacterium]